MKKLIPIVLLSLMLSGCLGVFGPVSLAQLGLGLVGPVSEAVQGAPEDTPTEESD